MNESVVTPIESFEEFTQRTKEENEESKRQENLEKFVESVREFVDIDDKIKAAQRDIRILKARKDQLSELVMGFMQTKQWEECKISTGGKIMLKTSKTKASVKKADALAKIQSYLKNENQTQDLIRMIFEEREVTEKSVLRRTTPRK